MGGGKRGPGPDGRVHQACPPHRRLVPPLAPAPAGGPIGGTSPWGSVVQVPSSSALNGPPFMVVVVVVVVGGIVREAFRRLVFQPQSITRALPVSSALVSPSEVPTTKVADNVDARLSPWGGGRVCPTEPPSSGRARDPG